MTHGIVILYDAFRIYHIYVLQTFSNSVCVGKIMMLIRCFLNYAVYLGQYF